MPALVLRRAPGASELSVRIVRKLADQMLEALGLARAELSVLLTDDRTIHRLNLTHRHKDRPTDVLAFPLQAEPQADGTQLLGDVVISIDTASRQAAARHRPLLAEVRFLLAHGILHLVGHDHDVPKRKRVMDAAARRLIRHAALPDTSKAGAMRPGRRKAPGHRVRTS